MADPSLEDGDWSTACTHYLLRASMQAARLRELSEQVVTCVSRGRISPASLRGRATLTESDRREYTARVAERTAQWFADVAAITRMGADPADDVLAGGTGLASWEQLPRLARAWFGLLDGLGEAGSHFAETYLASVLAGVRPSGLDAPFAVDLRAEPGETASAVLSLSNTRRDPAVVRCAATDVRRADGVGPSFVPRLAIAPGRLRLAADEAGDVRLSLRLEPGIYDPGAPYLGAVRLTRRGEPPVDVPLRILAAGPGGGAP